VSTPAELVIEVTADDIASGKPGSPCQCPIALAAIRALGEFEGVLKAETAGALWIALYRDSIDWEPYATYSLPKDVVAFVELFDNDRPVAPFTFTARRIGGAS
jgi:hypothetical protein